MGSPNPKEFGHGAAETFDAPKFDPVPAEVIDNAAGPAMGVPRAIAPRHDYDLYRSYFVANMLDGDDSCTLTIEGSVLADAVAEMFTSDHWRKTWNEALFEALCRHVGPGRYAQSEESHG